MSCDCTNKFNCPECKVLVSGVAFVKEGEVFHSHCWKKFDMRRQGYPHKCPKCGGTGTWSQEYNGYPSSLPDSGSVYEAAFHIHDCEVCEKRGYTAEKKVPITKVVGYE